MDEMLFVSSFQIFKESYFREVKKKKDNRDEFLKTMGLQGTNENTKNSSSLETVSSLDRVQVVQVIQNNVMEKDKYIKTDKEVKEDKEDQEGKYEKEKPYSRRMSNTKKKCKSKKNETQTQLQLQLQLQQRQLQLQPQNDNEFEKKIFLEVASEKNIREEKEKEKKQKQKQNNQEKIGNNKKGDKDFVSNEIEKEQEQEEETNPKKEVTECVESRYIRKEVRKIKDKEKEEEEEEEEEGKGKEKEEEKRKEDSEFNKTTSNNDKLMKNKTEEKETEQKKKSEKEKEKEKEKERKRKSETEQEKNENEKGIERMREDTKTAAHRYDECIEYEGSEYIYVHEINKKNGSHPFSDEHSNMYFIKSREDIIMFNVYDCYLNLIHLCADKMHFVKEKMKNIKLKKIQSTISDNTLSLTNEFNNLLNHKKIHMNDFVKRKKSETRLVVAVTNEECRNIVENGQKTKGNICSSLNSHSFIPVKERNDHNVIIDKMKNLGLSIFKSREKGCILRSQNKLQNFCFKEINFKEIKNNMQNNIDRRIKNQNIKDVKILKKGYSYVFIHNNEWKIFFCVFFFLKKCTNEKDIILKQFCKFYNKSCYIKLLKADELNSNYFLAFFKDENMECLNKTDDEINKLIVRNFYSFIFEISKKKKSAMTEKITPYVSLGNGKKSNSFITIFDIFLTPFFLIPVELCSLIDKKNGNAIKNAELQITINGSVLKDWNTSFNFVENGHINKRQQQRKNFPNSYDYNRMLHQWIQVFKRERNVTTMQVGASDKSS